MRKATVRRKTKETDIAITLNLDGHGKASVKTGIPFLDHMLTLLGSHGCYDLQIAAKGDLEIDRHHTNEDIGIALGEAFDKALDERKGIRRFGFFYVPMEEALVRVVLDFSGRPKLVMQDNRPKENQKPSFWSSSDYQWGDAEHFLESFSRAAKLTLHIEILTGADFHHTIEAVFKALARALDQATQRDSRVSGVPSSKGRL